MSTSTALSSTDRQTAVLSFIGVVALNNSKWWNIFFPKSCPVYSLCTFIGVWHFSVLSG